MFDWLKRHKILITIISFVIIFGVPLIIHVLFKIKAPNSFWVAEWSAGDLLSYYGSILAFLGTVVLGILALYQNHIIKIESDRRTELLEQMEYERNIPKFSAFSNGTQGRKSHLKFNIQNISENIASEVKLYNIKIFSPNNDIIWKSNDDYQYPCIPSNGIYQVDLKNPGLEEEGCIFFLELQCTDKFNKLHKFEIKGLCQKGENYPAFKVTKSE